MKSTKALIYIALIGVTGAVISAFGVNDTIFAAVFFSFAIVYLFIGVQNAAVVTVSLVLCALLIEVFLRIGSFENMLYYRPHERFSINDRVLGHSRYREGVDYEGLVPHGDLCALAVSAPVNAVPRSVVFKTDSLGFRNSSGYSGQEYVLVGDSFVVGNGSTQEHILSAQLRTHHGIDVYNLSHPGDLSSYAKYIDRFQINAGESSKYILYIFEGNDFYEGGRARQRWTNQFPFGSDLDRIFRSYRDFSNDTNIYKFTFSIQARLRKREERVVVYDVDDIPVGFLIKYISVVERRKFSGNEEFERVLAKISDKIYHIFFIPAKYRVYCDFIAECKESYVFGLPDSQWLYLKRMADRLGVAITNLTPSLIRESEKLLQSDRLTFWPDDTHWNEHGIAVAADEVARVIEAQGN